MANWVHRARHLRRERFKEASQSLLTADHYSTASEGSSRPEYEPMVPAIPATGTLKGPSVSDRKSSSLSISSIDSFYSERVDSPELSEIRTQSRLDSVLVGSIDGEPGQIKTKCRRSPFRRRKVGSKRSGASVNSLMESDTEASKSRPTSPIHPDDEEEDLEPRLIIPDNLIQRILAEQARVAEARKASGAPPPSEIVILDKRGKTYKSKKTDCKTFLDAYQSLSKEPLLDCRPTSRKPDGSNDENSTSSDDTGTLDTVDSDYSSDHEDDDAGSVDFDTKELVSDIKMIFGGIWSTTEDAWKKCADGDTAYSTSDGVAGPDSSPVSKRKTRIEESIPRSNESSKNKKSPSPTKQLHVEKEQNKIAKKEKVQEQNKKGRRVTFSAQLCSTFPPDDNSEDSSSRRSKCSRQRWQRQSHSIRSASTKAAVKDLLFPILNLTPFAESAVDNLIGGGRCN